MSKVLAESLYEFKESQKESVNEARGLFGDLAAQGKQFRKMFLPGAYAILKKGQKEQVVSLGKWLKKLAELGWPGDKDLKSKLGDKAFKSLQSANKFLNNALPAYAASLGGTTQARGGDTGKSDQERAVALAEVLGMEASDLAALLKKE